MKNRQSYGWAVIFAAMILLAACASHDAQVADTTMMSGADATLAQVEGQKSSVAGQKLQLETREAHLLAREGYANDRQQQLEQRRIEIERQESELAKMRLQLETREAHLLAREGYANDRQQQLEQIGLEMERRENALAIGQAWLNESGAQQAQGATELERQANALAIKSAWQNERERQRNQLGSGPLSSEQLAAVGSLPAIAEVGRCYASVFIPAKYKTVAVTKLVGSAQEKQPSIPAQYQTVTEQVKVTKDHMAWQEILCETNITQSKVSDIQRALLSAGFNPGSIDGVIGLKTMEAVNAFQESNNLTVAKHLTIETINALGVSL
jgi:hypothetical protein